MFQKEEVELLDKFLNGEAYDKKALDNLKKKVSYLNKRIKLTEEFEIQAKKLDEEFDKESK